MTENENLELDERISILMFMGFCHKKGLFIRDREAVNADDVELLKEYQKERQNEKE